MPELPEIETVKLQLEKVLVGQVCKEIKILSDKVIKGNIDEIIGRKVQKVERKGKVLLINFGEGLDLGFHFKMTGQLIYDDGKKRVVPSKHTRVMFHLRGGTLYFNDQRMFGWIMLNPGFVDKLGPEALTITTNKFLESLRKLKRPIKLAIMDQEIISGVGNIYANDALWEAKINPARPTNQLTNNQLTALSISIKKVLREGIKYGGATASDAKYIDLHGLGGHYQEHFRVYDREGQKCKRPACRQAGVKIEKFELGGRGTYWCPKCQK